MTLRQDWPKPDLLQQSRLELGLALEPAHVPPPLSLLFKGGMGALVLVMLAVLTLLGLQHRQQQVQVEVDALNPVERHVGDAKARLRAMRSRRSTLEQQTQSIAEQLVAVRSGSALLEQLRQVTPQGVRLVSLNANPSKLLIKGESQGADAFERINALDLNLEVLSDMHPDGTTVVKAFTTVVPSGCMSDRTSRLRSKALIRSKASAPWDSPLINNLEGLALSDTRRTP